MRYVWGLRHLRYWWHRRQAQRWARMWGDAGVGLGFINEHDERVLQEMWEGKL